MTLLNRIPVVWTGTPTNGGGLSVFYFLEGVGTPAQQVTAVNTFLGATDDQRSTALQWQCGQEVDTIESTTNQLVGTTGFAPAVGFGTNSGEVLSPATQGLLRMLTPTVFNGRLIRGRLFLPGPTESVNSVGRPAVTYRADYEAAAAALIADANTTWVVYSRAAGAPAAVTAANMWTEWATLRSRRD